MIWANPLNSLFVKHHDLQGAETPAPDPRWVLIAQKNPLCPCCNTPLGDLLSLAYQAPEDWPHPLEKQENGRILTADNDILTQDFCIIGDRHFIRAVMIIPLVGLEPSVILGLWVEVQKTDFDAYLQTMPGGAQGSMDLIFCTTANIIPGQLQKIACVMQPRDDFQRPIVHAAVDCDKLFVDQIDGFDFDQLMGFLNGFGHQFNVGL